MTTHKVKVSESSSMLGLLLMMGGRRDSNLPFTVPLDREIEHCKSTNTVPRIFTLENTPDFFNVHQPLLLTEM